MLGDWTAICLRCGAARRWFEEFEAEMPDRVPGLRRRDDPPLPVVLGAVLVDLRGRLRGVRGAAARADALRRPDPERKRVLIAEKRITVTMSSLGDLAVVELAQEVRHLLGAADLRVVVLDLARRELVEPLHLDLVDHRVEDVLARAVAGADEHRDDHPLLVLARLVAEPDRRGLAVRAELGLDDRRVEVEGEGGQPARIIRPSLSASRARARSAISRSPR